jgi:hypothetical protein
MRTPILTPENIQLWLDQQILGGPPGSPKMHDERDPAPDSNPFPELNKDWDLSLSSDSSASSRPRSAAALLSFAPHTSERPSVVTTPPPQPSLTIQEPDRLAEEAQHNVHSSGESEIKETPFEQNALPSRQERNRLSADRTNKIRKKSEKYMGRYFNKHDILNGFTGTLVHRGASAKEKKDIYISNSAGRRQYFRQKVLERLSGEDEFKSTYEVCLSRMKNDGLQNIRTDSLIINVIERLIEENKITPLSASHSGDLRRTDELPHSSSFPTPEALEDVQHAGSGEITETPRVNTRLLRVEKNRETCKKSNEIRTMATDLMDSYFGLVELAEGFVKDEPPQNALRDERRRIHQSNGVEKKKYIQQKMLDMFQENPIFKTTYDSVYSEMKSDSRNGKYVGGNRIIVEVIERLVAEGKI